MARSGTRRMKALTIPLIATAVVASACGSSSKASSSSPTSSGTASTGSTGSNGSTSTTLAPASVTIAVTGLPTVADIDPKGSSNGTQAGNVATNIAGTLFGYQGASFDPDTAKVLPDPLPQLATSASPSADGLTWTFNLRPNVLSQDGNPLTAADVVWTIKRALNTGQFGANLLKGIHIDTANPATATGPLTVQVHLTSPSSLVEKTFSASYLGIIDEKAVVANSPASDPWGYTYLGSHSATFGPYEVSVDNLPNKEVLVANPHYWRGAPQITKATFVPIANDSTRLESTLSGQVSYGAELSLADLTKIKATPSVQADLQPNVNLEFYLVFVMKSSLVQNASVRRAFSLAVNRSQVVSVAYNGYAQPVTSCIPGSLYAAPSAIANYNPAAGNLAKAKQLLAAGGGPKAISFGYPTGIPGSQTLAEVVQSDWQAMGVKTTLMPYTSYPTFLADQASGKFSIALEGFGPNVQDPGYFMYTTVDSSSSYDLGGFNDPALNTVLQQADTVTGSARAAVLANACSLQLQDAPVGPIVSVDGISAASSKFSQLSSIGGIPFLYNMRYQ